MDIFKLSSKKLEVFASFLDWNTVTDASSQYDQKYNGREHPTVQITFAELRKGGYIEESPPVLLKISKRKSKNGKPHDYPVYKPKYRINLAKLAMLWIKKYHYSNSRQYGKIEEQLRLIFSADKVRKHFLNELLIYDNASSVPELLEKFLLCLFFTARSYVPDKKTKELGYAMRMLPRLELKERVAAVNQCIAEYCDAEVGKAAYLLMEAAGSLFDDIRYVFPNYLNVVFSQLKWSRNLKH